MSTSQRDNKTTSRDVSMIPKTLTNIDASNEIKSPSLQVAESPSRDVPTIPKKINNESLMRLNKTKCFVRTFFVILLSNFLTLSLAAQSLPMSLDDCMAYAVEHSTSVGKKINALDDAQQQYN